MDDREKTYEDIVKINEGANPALTTSDSFNEAIAAIKENKSIILYGPPGTGKTRMAYLLKAELEKENILGKFETVQFHQKFTYEDFIEGYSPNTSGGFDKKDGIFKAFIKTASETDKKDIFLIDEINRADLTTTFGEILFLMDDRKERKVKTSHFADEIQLPENLVIIGTMNTADRNIASIDFALRRRFVFISLYTDYDELLEYYLTRTIKGLTATELVEAAKRINGRIASNRLMGKHMELGNSMWMPPGSDSITLKEVADQFRQVILPQVEAYCGYGYEDQLESIFNPNISLLYLNRKRISDEDIAGLIKDLSISKQ
jgi:5-methylcytosine-specific restriction enzyme B